MESLGKLRDGRGRGVVHQLIPQIKILDGTHLSSGEGGAVDAQTLDEADDLICQGASHARAAWAEEEETAAVALVAAPTASTEVAGGDGRRREGEGEEVQQHQQQADESFPAGLGGYSSLGHRTIRSKVVMAAAAEVNVGGCGSPPLPRPDHGGTGHWDSELTQGGRQALSGNPRFAGFFGYVTLTQYYYSPSELSVGLLGWC